MSNYRKQVVVGALLSYGAIVFNVLAGLFYTPWMIKMIGSDQYALYALATSVINLFLLDFGIGGALTKFLSNYYAKGEYDQANFFLGIVYKLFIAISLVIGICLFVFYFFIEGVYVKLSATEVFVFKRLFIIVGIYSVFTFPFTTFNGVLMANERFIAVKACNFGQKVLNVALIIVFLLLGKGVYALVIINVFSNVFFLIIKYAYIKKNTKAKANFHYKSNDLVKELFSYSIWITVMNIAQRCIFNIMPSIIAALIGATAVTIFSLSSTLEGYAYLFTDAINGMFMPRISRIFQKNNTSVELNELMQRVGRFHIFTLGLLYVGFILVGNDFVFVWLGSDYKIVFPCVVFLIFPSLLSAPQQIAHTSLLTQGIVRPQAFIKVIMALTNILLTFVLLPVFGILGSAISICISYVLSVVLMNFLYHKHLPIDLKSFYWVTYARWIPVALISIVLSWLAFSAISMNTSWLTLLIKAGIVCLIYFLAAYLIMANKDEKKIIIRFLRKTRSN